MAARGIEYIELYTNSQKSVIEFFVSSLGFTAVARSDEPDRSSTLLRQDGTQLVITSGPATAQFLGEHGDGIADIAFGCDDVPATRDAAVAAGARRAGDCVVSGFGDVRHTLVPAAGASPPGYPAGREWAEVQGTAAPPEAGRVRRADHVAVCLEAGTLHQVARFYTDGFGLDRYSSEYVEVGEQAMDSVVLRSASGGITFTMLEPDTSKRAGQINGFLERNHGAGVQHVAFLVDDIVAAVRAYRDRGIEFLATPGSYYDLLCERLDGVAWSIGDLRDTNVLADRDEWGYLLQIFTRSPYERDTLFYELIERKGARGFGSANIRALYEAVERERAIVS